MVQNKKIYISYSDNDQAKAIKLCEVLESSGFECWLSYRDTIPGKNLLENIFEAMSNSALMVVLYSEKALSEKRLVQEAEIAFDTEIPIIPLRIENVEAKGALKFVLSTLHWIEAHEKSFEEYFPQIISAIERLVDVEERKQGDNEPTVPPPDSGIFTIHETEASPMEIKKEKEYRVYSSEYPKWKKLSKEEYLEFSATIEGRKSDFLFIIDEGKNKLYFRGNLIKKSLPASSVKTLKYLLLEKLGLTATYREIYVKTRNEEYHVSDRKSIHRWISDIYNTLGDKKDKLKCLLKKTLPGVGYKIAESKDVNFCIFEHLSLS